MVQKDRRIRLVNEVLNGIKMIKLYAWENHFREDVENIRKKELAIFKQIAYFNTVDSFSWKCTPYMVSTYFTFIKLYAQKYKGVFGSFWDFCSY